MDKRRLAEIVIVVLVAVSLISVLAYAMGWWALGFMPFLFLFFPLYIPLGRRETHEGPYCPECGNPVDPGDGFCRVCGRRL